MELTTSLEALLSRNGSVKGQLPSETFVIQDEINEIMAEMTVSRWGRIHLTLRDTDSGDRRLEVTIMKEYAPSRKEWNKAEVNWAAYGATTATEAEAYGKLLVQAAGTARWLNRLID